jgi:biotin transport system substrate-specific component
MYERTAPLSRPEAIAAVVTIIAASAVTAALAQVSVDIGPVPQTGQTLGVLGIGCLLGSRRAAAAMLLYVGEGLAGLPVFADGDSGLHVLTGSSGGYLAGFVVAAFMAGWLCERLGRRFYVTAPAMLAASVPMYALGLLWFKQSGPYSWAFVVHWGLSVFVIGDLLKIAAAAAALDPSAPWGRLLGRLSRS